MLVCITQSYLAKVAGRVGCGADASDNSVMSQSDSAVCREEFSYAVRTKGVQQLIPVVLERGCRRPDQWRGPVAMHLGCMLYVDLADDDIDKGMAHLKREVVRVVGHPASSAAGASHVINQDEHERVTVSAEEQHAGSATQLL